MKAGSFFIHLGLFLLAIVIFILLFIFVFPLSVVAPAINISSLLAPFRNIETASGSAERKAVLLSEVTIGRSVFFAEVMTGEEERNRGLSGRESLPRNRGMLFIFPKKDNLHFWMKNMFFPIDIIWISDNKVVGIDRNALPDGDLPTKAYASPEPVNRVIEVNAGFAAENNISVGDEVVIK